MRFLKPLWCGRVLFRSRRKRQRTRQGGWRGRAPGRREGASPRPSPDSPNEARPALIGRISSSGLLAPRIQWTGPDLYIPTRHLCGSASAPPLDERASHQRALLRWPLACEWGAASRGTHHAHRHSTTKSNRNCKTQTTSPQTSHKKQNKTKTQTSEHTPATESCQGQGDSPQEKSTKIAQLSFTLSTTRSMRHSCAFSMDMDWVGKGSLSTAGSAFLPCSNPRGSACPGIQPLSWTKL